MKDEEESSQSPANFGDYGATPLETLAVLIGQCGAFGGVEAILLYPLQSADLEAAADLPLQEVVARIGLSILRGQAIELRLLEGLRKLLPNEPLFAAASIDQLLLDDLEAYRRGGDRQSNFFVRALERLLSARRDEKFTQELIRNSFEAAHREVPSLEMIERRQVEIALHRYRIGLHRRQLYAGSTASNESTEELEREISRIKSALKEYGITAGDYYEARRQAADKYGAFEATPEEHEVEDLIELEISMELNWDELYRRLRKKHPAVDDDLIRHAIDKHKNKRNRRGFGE